MEKRKGRNYCGSRRVRSKTAGMEANTLAGAEKEMEKRKGNDCSSRRVRINTGGVEANTLALIDFAESHNNSQEANDDCIDFLEAVRNTSIVRENGTPPTEKMVEAVYQILRTGKSLELIMSSYELLNEIEKRFPRVYMCESSDNGSPEVVIIDEAWLPFMFSSDVLSSLRESTSKSSGGSFDRNGFHELIQCLAEFANERTTLRVDLKSLGNMLLFQYLVNVIEGDFVPRINAFKETMNWNLLRSCLLNMLLGSGRFNYKVLIRDCLYAVCGLCQHHDESECSETSSSENHNTDLAIASLEVQKNTCMAMQKLLLMIMELDTSKKQADMYGQTTRADGVRTSLTDIILDELTYDRDILSHFLQTFKDPKQKLEIILQFFLKYTAKPAVRTRRSNGPSEDSTFVGVLKSFSSSTSTRNIVKKMDVEVVQLLLAHAYQAYMSMSSQQLLPGISYSKEDTIDGSLVDISKNVIAAFNSLRGADKNITISSLGKEALFTAAMIISTS